VAVLGPRERTGTFRTAGDISAARVSPEPWSRQRERDGAKGLRLCRRGASPAQPPQV